MRSLVCVIATVRLAGESSDTAPNVGRVEIFHNGTWGTVCDACFDMTAVAVICGMLGFR